MKTLLKQIRSYLNLSQTEFAEQLNVTFQTVNRWENGKVVPNKLAQSKIYDFCKKNNVPVYDFIINKITDVSNNIKLENGRILLYHGSKSGIEGNIAPLSRKQCDFGKGFYMGTEPAQALTLICDYEKSKFYIISIYVDELAHLEVPANIEWAMIVAYNRGRMEKINGTPFYNKYRDMTLEKDLVIGNIANDRMYTELARFFNGTITDVALHKCLSVLDLGKQYVAITQKACDQIKILEERNLHLLERLALQDKSVTRRAEGIALADEVVKQYRREGQFFDEILGGI